MKRLWLLTLLTGILIGCGGNPPSPPSLTALPAEPRRVEFQTEDGVNLVGYYHPAALNPAPIVVLMHWGNGDQRDWLSVGLVSWLQNRGAKVRESFVGPYPFTPLPQDVSFAVFTFDFRGYGESEGEQGEGEHILDARAAYRTAAGLEGVDASRMVGIGASMGADAVVDAGADIAGALSISPGNWLGISFADAVKAMKEQNKPVWSVAAGDDQYAFQATNAASGPHYHKQSYPSGGHAMSLFLVPDQLQPSLETVILDFLRSTLPTHRVPSPHPQEKS